MRNRDRESARHQIDKRLNLVQKFQDALTPTSSGWVRAIRDALGMTSAQLGGSITLESLVEVRATILARKRLASTRHTMALEAQSVSESDETAQLQKLVRHLVAHSGSRLWDAA